jgi:hypothetical protein
MGDSLTGTASRRPFFKALPLQETNHGCNQEAADNLTKHRLQT